MGITITKIKLFNYRRFRNYTIYPNERINVLVGNNESGKSTVLEAIELVSTGSVHRVENIGLDKLINIEAVEEFLAGEHTFKNLPVNKKTMKLYKENKLQELLPSTKNRMYVCSLVNDVTPKSQK